MIPARVNEATAVPPPAYHRAQARLGPALHIEALTRVEHLAPAYPVPSCCAPGAHQCPPALPASPGGAPRTYSEESRLIIALLRTLWRLSYQDMRDWLRIMDPKRVRKICD